MVQPATEHPYLPSSPQEPSPDAQTSLERQPDPSAEILTAEEIMLRDFLNERVIWES